MALMTAYSLPSGVSLSEAYVRIVSFYVVKQTNMNGEDEFYQTTINTQVFAAPTAREAKLPVVETVAYTMQGKPEGDALPFLYSWLKTERFTESVDV